MLSEKLISLGLTPKEASLYLELLKRETLSANMLAKQTGSHRTVAYNILQQLVEKGLVSYVVRGGKRMYAPADPSLLVEFVKEKEALAKTVAKELCAVRSAPVEMTNVDVFEGKGGLRQAFSDISRAKKLCVLNATGLLFNHLPFSATHITKKIAKNDVRIIATQDMRGTPLADIGGMKIKYLPGKQKNYATTFISKNFVIIQTLKNEPVLIRIQNKEICEGYLQNFELLWKCL